MNPQELAERELLNRVSEILDKHCFLCGGKNETTSKPLRETVGGNFLHKACADDMSHLKLTIPKFKRKARK